MISSVPELRQKPIVIGECDPDGCAACLGPQLGYRTGAMYASYTAASLARQYALADRHGVSLEGSLTWAFEFEDQPYFAGQRVLASNGIDLPVLNLFRMLSRMGGRRLQARSSQEVPLDAIVTAGVRASPDVSALASLDGDRLCVLVWHYHDDQVPGPDAQVELVLTNLPRTDGPASLTHYRIDEFHSNAFAEWRRLGSPAEPGERQYAMMKEAGGLGVIERGTPTVLAQGRATLRFPLPRQAVSLLVLDWQ
jgi:xylan 1,4-beta-xylosidase